MSSSELANFPLRFQHKLWVSLFTMQASVVLLALQCVAPQTGDSTPIRIAKSWVSALSYRTSEMLSCAGRLLRRSSTHSAIDRVHGAFRSLHHGRVRAGRCALRDPMGSNALTVWRVRPVSISLKRSADWLRSWCRPTGCHDHPSFSKMHHSFPFVKMSCE